MPHSKCSLLPAVVLCGALAPAVCPAWAQSVEATETLTGRTLLAGNVHPAVRGVAPLSACDPGMPMQRMILSLKLAPAAQARMAQALRDLQDPHSPSYHQWYTPEQVAAAFGPSADQLAQVTGWLRSQGFTLDEVAPSGMAIQFSGDVQTVEQAFRTPIMNYLVQGHLRHANAADPSIPTELADLVNGVVSLHNIPRRPMLAGPHTLSSAVRAAMSRPQWNGTSQNTTYYFLATADLATIYNTNPLYQAGYTGQGLAIAIVGRTHPHNATQEWADFRTDMGLPANPPNFVLNGTDPGDLSLLDSSGYQSDDLEASLDVELSGAMAPAATIDFVCSASTQAEDGSDLSAEYAVDHRLAPILSDSFGDCELSMGAAGNQFYNRLWQQAALEGITVLVASGDTGAAGCYGDGQGHDTAASVNGIASSPYVVAVGGTQFNDAGSYATYWDSADPASPTFGGTAKSYIPELVWNDGHSANPPGASGGGGSSWFLKPSWQDAVTPGDGWRDEPDVSLAGSDQHDPYIAYAYYDFNTYPGSTSYNASNDGPQAVGGTSCASPTLAGILALVEQEHGAFQGNVNPVLYYLGTQQYQNSGATVFHDITSGDSTVKVNGTTVTGYTASGGYDLATGLGSVDAEALAANWTAGVVIALAPSGSVGLLPGLTASFMASENSSPDASVSWNWAAAALSSSLPDTRGVVTAGSPASSASFSASVAGTYFVTAADPSTGQSTSVTVLVHTDPGGLGSPGLDLLDMVGHLGLASAMLDVTGDGQVSTDDVTQYMNYLGWANQ